MLNNFNYILGSFGSECRQCILEMNTNRRLRRRRTERERGGRGRVAEMVRERGGKRRERGGRKRGERKKEAVNYIYPRELIRSLN